MQLQWDNGTGKLAFAIFVVPRFIAPVKLRSALSDACGFRLTDWNIDSASDVVRGTARNDRFECSYLASEGDSTYDVTVRVKGPNSE